MCISICIYDQARSNCFICAPPVATHASLQFVYFCSGVCAPVSLPSSVSLARHMQRWSSFVACEAQVFDNVEALVAVQS